MDLKLEWLEEGHYWLLCPGCDGHNLHRTSVEMIYGDLKLHFRCEDCDVKPILKLYDDNGDSHISFRNTQPAQTVNEQISEAVKLLNAITGVSRPNKKAPI